jgi:hypothetical protein
MSGNSYYAIQSFDVLVCEIGVVVSEHNLSFFTAEYCYKFMDGLNYLSH